MLCECTPRDVRNHGPPKHAVPALHTFPIRTCQHNAERLQKARN